MKSTLLKICGITRAEDLRAAESAGADYVGLILVPGSPRCISPDAAAVLCRMCRSSRPVLVTADRPLAELNCLIEKIRPYAVQLHGSETPRYAASVVGAEVWRAVHLQTFADVASAAEFPSAMLVADGASGGSGVRCDWRWAAALARVRPILLAGGITPENARSALMLTGAAGLDVGSGVEIAPGIKSNEKIEQLTRSVKR